MSKETVAPLSPHATTSNVIAFLDGITPERVAAVYGREWGESDGGYLEGKYHEARQHPVPWYRSLDSCNRRRLQQLADEKG